MRRRKEGRELAYIPRYLGTYYFTYFNLPA